MKKEDIITIFKNSRLNQSKEDEELATKIGQVMGNPNIKVSEQQKKSQEFVAKKMAETIADNYINKTGDILISKKEIKDILIESIGDDIENEDIKKNMKSLNEFLDKATDVAINHLGHNRDEQINRLELLCKSVEKYANKQSISLEEASKNPVAFYWYITKIFKNKREFIDKHLKIYNDTIDGLIESAKKIFAKFANDSNVDVGELDKIMESTLKAKLNSAKILVESELIVKAERIFS